jgi:hypothetical protein
MESTAPARPPRTVPGRWIVLTMFAFGIAATGGIWVYWKLHLAPFMPLQKALAAEFPKSSPRVDGGWSGKEFQQGPPRLRIVLRVPYPPLEQDARVSATIDRVVELARAHLDFTKYETLEIYLVHYAPERAPQQFEFKARIRDLASGDPTRPSTKAAAGE